MNPINPVCRPATENEINYGEAKWCAKCTSECDSKGKDELVMCDYFKTNDNGPIVPGCPSLMPHALPGGFYGVAHAEEGTQMPEPKEFAAREATREKSSQVGNAAKMREALNEARRFVFASAQRADRDLLVSDEKRGVYVLTPKDTLVKIDAALSAQPRNCDRPECATSDAAQYTWNNEDGGKTAYYEWLLAAYTEGGTTDGKKH